MLVPPGRISCSSPALALTNRRGPGEPQVQRHFLPDEEPADLVVGRQEQRRGQRGHAIVVLQHLHPHAEVVVDVLEQQRRIGTAGHAGRRRRGQRRIAGQTHCSPAGGRMLPVVKAGEGGAIKLLGTKPPAIVDPLENW